MILKRLEIAYPGMHGQDESKLTEDMITDCVRNFKGVVPAVISHAAARLEKVPAVGRVIFLDRPKKRLEAVVELSDDLDLAMLNREVNSWSPGFAKGGDGWYLHHLAFSGSVPGKMRDLKVLAELEQDKEFLEGKDVKLLEFTDSENLLKLEDFGMDEEVKKLIETVNSLVKDVKELSSDVKELKKASGNGESTEEGKKVEELEKAYSDKISALQKELGSKKKDEFLKSLEGRLPKEEIDKIGNFLDSEKGQEALFSDTGENDAEGLLSLVSGAFDKLPKVDLEGEVVDFSDTKGSADKVDYADLAGKL